MAARADFRRRWRSAVFVTLVIGIAGSVVLTAFAGARRTSSAFDRLRDETRAGQVTVNTFRVDPRFAAQIGRLPGVESSAPISGWAAFPIRAGYRSVAAAVDRRFGRTVDRSLLVSGRRARPENPNEIVLGANVARSLHLGVGDDLALTSYTPEQTRAQADATDELDMRPAGPTMRLRIVGTDRRSIDATPLGDQAGLILLPESVYRKYHTRVGDFSGFVRVRLEPDTSTKDFIRRVRAIAGTRTVDFDTGGLDDDGVNNSLSVLASGLLLFGAVGGLGAIAAVAVMSARAAASRLDVQPAWRALGMTRTQRMLAVLLPTLPAAAGGAMLATLGAWAASWFMPIAVARGIEPEPGFDFDAWVLGPGFGALVVVIAGLAVWNAARVSRRTDWDTTGRRAGVHTSRWAGIAVRAGARPSVVIGMAMALEPGGGKTAVPVRSALVGGSLGVFGIVAALVVGASLDRFVAEPARHGWNFDAVVNGSGGERGTGSICGERRSTLESDPDIAAIARMCFTSLVVDGRPVSAMGFTPRRGRIRPVTVRGRAPSRKHEVALGEKTLGKIHRLIGDEITVRGSRGSVRARIVGTAVFPSVSDPVSMADGAIMVPSVLSSIAAGDSNSFGTFVVRWRPGIDLAAARARIAQVSGEKPSAPIRPAEVDRLRQLDRLPFVLAAFLAALTLIAIGHAIVTNASRRRRDLAVLETLGFRSRQVFATIATQASTLAFVGLVIGIPLGVMVGRLTWRAIADQIGVANDPAIPLFAIAALVPLTILATLMIAYFPARSVSAVRPALALRSE